MENNNQASADATGNLLNADPSSQMPANDVLPTDLQKYVAEPANADANSTSQAPPQAPVQAQNQPMQSTEQTRIAELQRIANEKQVMAYQLQQELDRLRNTQQAQPQVAQNQNPHDPNTDWAGWMRYEQQQAARLAAQETTSQLLQYAQQQARVQQDIQWQQSHPNVDINQIKGFAQMRGISNLDDAYTLYSLPSQIASVQTQAVNQTLNNFRQPTQMATPVRNGQSSNATVGLSYEKMASEFQATNGRAYESWSQPLRDLFDKETYRREEARSGR